ncbi:hypothetical protein FBALC1_08893 [Flavobacteriales bacterium ALC-1]|nr:hypothetical protein FBALC1_08893 [Flavobacteriales bacterium ALC-1]
MLKLIQKLTIIGCVFVASQVLYSQTSKEDPNLQAAFQAQGSLKLLDAKQLFQKVVINPKATKKDQCEALRELAIIEWKFYNKYKEAKALLHKADSIGDYRSETWLKLLRVEAESNNYAKAIEAGQKAIILSESKADKNYSKYKFCKAILDEAISQVNTDKSHDISKLSEAGLILKEVLYTNPTHVNAANILLGISLLLKDGDTAMKTWLSYNRFTNVNSAYAYLKPAAEQLNQILPNWNNSPLTTSEQEQIIEGLGKSRFYEYARVLAKLFKLKEAETSSNTKHIVAYANYINDVKSLTNTYYRLVSTENNSSEDFINALRSKNRLLFKQLTLNEKQQDTFSTRTFRDSIRSKFGSMYLISTSSASRTTGLVLGHIVNERIRNIEQYGHNADFTFTELDKMVSNGYPSWFWENRGAGGYALRGGFLRIKSMFNYLAIDAWERVTDTVKRSKIEKSIEDNLFASDLNTDIKIIRSAVAKKIELDALDTLYKRLVADGFEGISLQLKFIEQYELYRDNATMFAHEGRHSIDRVVLGDGYRALGSAKIEYRGRLSQIAFSASPKLELSNMLNGIGSSPTGQSNKMILDVIETFINANKGNIPNFETSMQPIAQIYKLTDAQIINCIKNADPFYLAYSKN